MLPVYISFRLEQLTQDPDPRPMPMPIGMWADRGMDGVLGTLMSAELLLVFSADELQPGASSDAGVLWQLALSLNWRDGWEAVRRDVSVNAGFFPTMTCAPFANRSMGETLLTTPSSRHRSLSMVLLYAGAKPGSCLQRDLRGVNRVPSA